MLNHIVKLDCIRIIRNVNLNKFKKKNILILGSNGLLGSYILATLSLSNKLLNLKCNIDCYSFNKPRGIAKDIIQSDTRVNFFKKDLNKIQNRSFFKKKYNYIFHCATYAQPSLWMKKINSTINLNINILKILLDLSKKDNSKLMFFSSVDVYGIKRYKKQITENLSTENSVFNFRSAYGKSKKIGEALCKFYRKKFGLNIFVVRPAHTYGPGLSLKDKRAMSEFMKKGIKDKIIKLKDDGKAIKTYGYISDITEMFLNIIQSGKTMTYNTVGKDFSSIKDIATLIGKNLNVKVKKGVKRKKDLHIGSDASKVKISSKKYCLEFKKKEFIDINTGIKNTINWNLGYLNR